MAIILITFDNYTERLPEVIGPFDDHKAAESWLNDLVDSGITENPSSDLSAATFTITKMQAAWPIVDSGVDDDVLQPTAHNYALHTDVPIGDAIEERSNGRWYIKMGFAGFNSAANNNMGYAYETSAIRAIRRYQQA